jgi:hypothetical protein
MQCLCPIRTTLPNIIETAFPEHWITESGRRLMPSVPRASLL